MGQPASAAVKDGFREVLDGALLSLVFAVLAFLTWWFLRDTWLKFSALLWAFTYSIIAVNLVPALTGDRFRAGIEFASSPLLRRSIALLGLTVSASVWVKLGGPGVALVLINLVFAFAFAIFLCKYVLRLNDPLAILVGVGTSICGASAVAATAPAIKARAEETGLSLAVITLFGLLAMFAYPALFSGPLGGWLGMDPLAYGIWAGTGIHETAQVIAAASQVDGALPIAVSAKFVRILSIGPMVLVSTLLYRRLSSRTRSTQVKVAVPWFAVAFVTFTLAHYGLESLPIREWWSSFNAGYLQPLVTFLLAWSFAGVGLKVRASAIAAIGPKAFAGGMVAAIVAGGMALLLVRYLWMPLSG
ncbi:MAG: putative sulfate exporter family transporter [Chloroflexi bacterium]|nr:putative sulfate exporter family transporter [Chloroflexota bacterium]